MKQIYVPYIEGVEGMSFQTLDKVMEVSASKDFISEVNWKDYPYRPAVAFGIARSSTHLAVVYHVRGLDLRAAALEDNGAVWEDSCCEFFISHPTDGTYYNFELNCIGTLLAAKRKSRTDAEHFCKEDLERIIRHTTLKPLAYDESGEIKTWSTAIVIPFDLMGLDKDNLPESVRANFYKCADKAAHPHFLSWNRINVPSPDFHRPEFFGEIIFQEKES